MNTAQEKILPKGWREVRLGEVFDIKTYSSKGKFLDPKGEQVIVDMGSISQEGKLLNNKRTNYQGDFLSIGDLVMPKDDIGNGKIIGKVAIIKQKNKYVCSDHVYRLMRKTDDDINYIYFAINSFSINKKLRLKASGTSQLGLNKKEIQKQEILIPPLSEQKAISSLLEKWDIAIEKTEALIAAKQKQFEWLRNRLFKEILIKDRKSFYLSTICKIQTGKKDVNQGNSEGLYPFFTCAKEHTYSDTYSYDMQAILLAGNGYIGNPILYKGKFEAYQRTYILYDFVDINPEYLNYFLKWVLNRKIVQEKQESAMSYIRLETLQTIKVISPTLLKQQSIVENFNTTQHEITLLKQLAEKYRIQKRGLMQKLLTGKWRTLR